ncbi:hypothetical protein WAI453_006549 [Rhynchosporium graminicola]
MSTPRTSSPTRLQKSIRSVISRLLNSQDIYGGIPLVTNRHDAWLFECNGQTKWGILSSCSEEALSS